MIEPAGDRVLIELEGPQEFLQVGDNRIYLPAAMSQKPSTEGVVAAIGAGPFGIQGNRAETPIRVGDRVFIPPYQGNAVEADGKHYQLVREADILAVRREPALS